MDAEKLKIQLGANITAYRKKNGLTQAGLAEKLNYSDKAVSKWERGESTPDVPTLAAIAQLFEVPVDVLLADPNALPEDPSPMGQAVERAVEKALKRKANKTTILALSSILVWGVALLIYVVLASLALPGCWISFIYAVPINAIVLLSLRSAWHDFRQNRALISLIVWGCLACVHLTALCFFHVDLWRIYLLGIPGQAAVLLSFRVFHKTKEAENG
ncbi:MAG TPA: helix-turn-helix transcriptional regulator [Candidatus Faecousia intestinigallinarum]|nr:helix-turn-helix transcriptional regulator [Candidatus Faecousia intestinigallinarum]